MSAAGYICSPSTTSNEGSILATRHGKLAYGLPCRFNLAAHLVSLADRVKKLEDDRAGLHCLAGEMLSTLLLDANRPHVHPHLLVMAKKWRERFIEFGANPELAEHCQKGE